MEKRHLSLCVVDKRLLANHGPTSSTYLVGFVSFARLRDFRPISSCSFRFQGFFSRRKISLIKREIDLRQNFHRTPPAIKTSLHIYIFPTKRPTFRLYTISDKLPSSCQRPLSRLARLPPTFLILAILAWSPSTAAMRRETICERTGSKWRYSTSSIEQSV